MDGSQKQMSYSVRPQSFVLTEFGSKTCLVQINALSVLTFVGSLAEPDEETISAETTALQKLSAGPFHALPSAMLLRRSTCGLKIDVDGIQLTRKAARFRVAFRSLSLSTSMAVEVVVRGFPPLRRSSRQSDS